SSAWGQVGPKRYCHQANLVLIRSFEQINKSGILISSKIYFSNLTSVRYAVIKRVWRCMVKPHGQLVQVS
ncbi:hypothetical protein, partial [Pseudoalteromonas sp. P1-8]|uniref:hypothetical protein n=1 Tax=Pseudoalteromonas sp. P1-8 TaxID=1710353 RepID=UPI001F28DEB8